MKKRNSKLKTIAATSMSIFSLAAVFVSTIAWFTANRKVDSNGDGFIVTSYDGLVKGVTAHKLLSITEEGKYIFNYSSPDITYTVSSNGKISTTDSITSIGKYDSMYNDIHFAVLFVITLDASIASNRNESVRIVPSTTTPYTDSLFGDAKLKVSGNPMSSILQFSYSSSYDLNTVGAIDDKGNTYEKMSFSTPTALQNFISPGGTSDTYKTVLNGYSIAKDIFTDTTKDYYAYVILEYSIENIEYIYNLNLSSDVLTKVQSTVEYKQDWKISIS